MRVPTLPTLPDLPTAAGRAAHDIGLAGLLGGNLFGRLALHPAVANISGKAERGKDGLVAAVTLTGLATTAEGMRFARQASSGAVPIETGSDGRRGGDGARGDQRGTGSGELPPAAGQARAAGPPALALRVALGALLLAL